MEDPKAKRNGKRVEFEGNYEEMMEERNGMKVEKKRNRVVGSK